MDDDARKINYELFSEIKNESFEVLYALDTSTERAMEVNRDLLLRVISKNRETEYGKKYGFSEIHDVDAFRSKVPLTTYDDYAPYIARMAQQGEENLLTAVPPVYYPQTSGSTGFSKIVPLTEDGMAAFLNYSTACMTAAIAEFYRNTRHTEIEFGKECAIICFAREKLPCGVDRGPLSAAFMDDGDEEDDIAYYETTPKEVMNGATDADMRYLHARYALAEPDLVYFSSSYIPAILDIMQYIRDHYELLVRDIREGIIDPGICMPPALRGALEAALSPDPARADQLQAEFRKGFDPTIMKRVWPRLAAVCTIWSGNYLPYSRKLQRYSGRNLPYYGMSYVASEGVFGVARHPYDPYYVMIPDSCFYEFIPADRQEEAEHGEPETLLLNELEEGKEYELVITNQSGFYRYRMGDVIRVAGYYNESPMVEFRYRKRFILSLAGEKITEDHVISAVRELERISGIQLTDFSVYPDQTGEKGRYTVYLEPDHPVPADRAEECGRILDRALCRVNLSYEVVKTHIGQPRVVFLRQQTFQRFKELRMKEQQISENQLKTIRVLSNPRHIRFFEENREQESR